MKQFMNLIKNKNPDHKDRDFLYRWVSKYGNQIPFTILKNISATQKIFLKIFIHIFYCFCNFLFRVASKKASRFYFEIKYILSNF